MCGGSVLFLRFVRVKTSQENGLSLFPEIGAVTCPVSELAAALDMQATPTSSLLPHLPAPSSADISDLGPLIPLTDVLAGATVDLDLLRNPIDESAEAVLSKPKGKRAAAPGIHSYVNRVLAKISGPAGVKTALTAHS